MVALGCRYQLETVPEGAPSAGRKKPPELGAWQPLRGSSKPQVSTVLIGTASDVTDAHQWLAAQ